METKEAFRSRLVQLRSVRRLTQAELALKAGLPPAAISHFETGFRFPAPQTLMKLSTALGVTVDHLLGGEPLPTPVGPVAEALFRNFTDLPDDAQQQLADLAQLLRDRAKKAHGVE